MTAIAGLLLLLLVRTATADYAELVRADRPAAYFRFDESSGIAAVNETPLLGDGAYRAAQANRRGLSGLSAAFGRTHVNGRVEIPLNGARNRKTLDLLNGSFSVEFWLIDEAAKPDNRINYSLFYKADQKRFTKNSMWLYRTRQDGRYSFRIQGEGEPVNLMIPNPAGEKPAGDGKWHHLVITVDRSKPNILAMRAFVDTRIVAQREFQTSVEIKNGGPLIIGSNMHFNSPWQGVLDEFALYNQVIDAATIRRHFEAGLLSMKLPAKSASPLALQLEHFETKVRPLLIEKCRDCHNAESDETALRLDSRSALLAGGDFGPAIIPGRADDSLLMRAVKRIHKELKMPPEQSDMLTRSEIASLAKWINDGAAWPKSDPVEIDRKASLQVEELEVDPHDHWAFLPRTVVEPPKVEGLRWTKNAIDRFLQAKREENGIAATVRADRYTLIRRATFDLTGLPPTPEEVAAFLNDKDEDTLAFAKVVDRLLASRTYGEKQGRRWLDVARYADTQGDVGDFPIPQAYLYRNWVIDALNRDLPFDRFLQAQIAGDILSLESSDTEEAKRLAIATGFIAISRRFGNTKKDDIHLTIEDTIDTIGRGIMGVTLRCSRCHDHKFDPITNRDYYALYGIFESTIYPWMGQSNEKSPSDLSPEVPDPKSRQEAQKYWDLITRYEYQINNHFRPWLKPTLDEYKRVTKELESLGGETKSEQTAALNKRRDELLGRHKGRFRELMIHGLPWIRRTKQDMAENPPVRFIWGVTEGNPHDAKLHRRGNPQSLGEVVQRGFPTVFGVKAPPMTGNSGRLGLAMWLTRPDHPLTARVIVNRIWQQHFGQGIVSTLDNFGRQGSQPTHPDLLDWLAESFIRTDGWSLKKLHRRIMLTESYQLATHEEVGSADWITTQRRRRLDAEEIRDAMLAVSGKLNRTSGGPHPFKHWYQVRYSLNGPFYDEFETNRRSVYMMTQRLFRNSFLALFDGPDTNTSTSMRRSANVPAQALFLMNSQFVKQQSESLAARVERSKSDDEGIETLYQLAYQRSPDAAELAAIRQFLKRYRQQSKTPEANTSHEAMVALCRSILTSNEFFFLD